MALDFSLAVLMMTGCLVSMASATGTQPVMVGNKEKSYTVKAGFIVKLRCRATGWKDANLDQRTLFFWTKITGQNKGLVKPQKFSRFEIKQGKFLKIRNVQPEDSGVYVCSATNAFGTDSARRTLKVVGVAKRQDTRKERAKVTETIQLKVPYSLGDSEAKPVLLKPRLSFTSKTYTVGDDIRLKCVVRANPDPVLRWTINRTQLNITNRMDMTSNNGTVSIRSIQMEDAGNYTCTAQNKLGTTTARYEIVVEKAAKQKRSSSLIVETGSNLTLSCETLLQKHKGTLPRIEWRQHVVGNEAREKRFLSPVENEARSRKDSKRHIDTVQSRRASWSFEVIGNRTLLSRFTFTNNVSLKDAGFYKCYVGKPGNWRHANTVVVRVRQASDPKPIDQSQDGIYMEEGVPLLLIVGIPVLAGFLCLAIVVLCWKCTKKSVPSPIVKSEIVREDHGSHTQLSLCSTKGKRVEARLSQPHSDAVS